MTNTVRWGILGTGRIARDFATALRDTPGATLAAVASRERATAETFADEFGIPLRLAGYDSLAACADVDLVYIGTPHAMHAENALAMLAGGKGVLCEKPFALNRAQAEQVVALARSRRVFLMEAMWTRFMPALAEAKRILASGVLGEVSQASADFGFAATGGPEARLFNPALGGGALLDVGIYPLSITAYLLGAVDAVRAQAELGPTGVDLQTVFTLRHASGSLSTCACSLKARTPGLLTVSGRNGHLRLDAPFHRAPTVTLTLAGEPPREIPTPYLGNGYVHEAIEAQRCWTEGLIESPAMTHEQTLHLMGVLDEIRHQIGVRYPGD
jgi:predicted dehydrogenase